MRIAYLGQMADVATENGISKKIRTQASAWGNAGHAVRYFALAPTDTVWAGLAPVETEVLARGGPSTRARQSLRLAQRIRAWRPDLIYFRYAHHSPGLPALFRDIPTVAEINSDDQTEYPLTLSPLKLAYHWLTRARVLRAVSGFVPVTNELARRFAGFAKPATVIANSIDLTAFTPAPLPALPPSLVFVGSSGTPWHGLERVAEISALLPTFTIDLVGCEARGWPGPDAPPAALKFHGTLAREHYDPIVRRATAAIGTLGLFRKQMDEACPLKVREYLAMGVPVIAAYKDTDIPPTADYFLRLPNNSDLLVSEQSRLATFVAHWARHRVPRESVGQLDTARKESQRLAFLARIAQRLPV